MPRRKLKNIFYLFIFLVAVYWTLFPSPSKTPTDVVGVLKEGYCFFGQRQFSFNFNASRLTNGTRPYSCNNCFDSDFPALVENTDVCKSKGVSDKVAVFIILFSIHGAEEKRKAIRETWASVTRNNTANMRMAFFLGRKKPAPPDRLYKELKEDELEVERRTYNDLVVHDFVDDYQNLTLKTMASFHWAVRNCGQARFVVKSDDDMWLNMHNMLDSMNREEGQLQTSIGGYCRGPFKPIRNPRNKWHASVKDFPQASYPGFCYGTAYATTMNLVRKIVEISPNVPFFHLEDVYLALCIEKLGEKYSLHSMSGFLHSKDEPTCKLVSKKVLTVHKVEPKQMHVLFNANCSTA